MNIKLIACKVLSREIGLLTATCPSFVDTTYLRQGYHNYPDILRQTLQAEIDLVESGDDPHTCDPERHVPDAIVLGYGLCSGGVKGLVSKKYKLVIPRAHDCITLFLGSKERYREYFDAHPGTYWYTQGWIDNTIMPSETYIEHYREIYARDYDEDNAEFLVESQLSWLKNYNNASYVRFAGIGDDEGCSAFTKKASAHFGWSFDELDGDLSLLRKALWGDWDSESFLVLEPGETLDQSYDENVIVKV